MKLTDILSHWLTKKDEKLFYTPDLEDDPFEAQLPEGMRADTTPLFQEIAPGLEHSAATPVEFRGMNIPARLERYQQTILDDLEEEALAQQVEILGEGGLPLGRGVLRGGETYITTWYDQSGHGFDAVREPESITMTTITAPRREG